MRIRVANEVALFRLPFYVQPTKELGLTDRSN